ncbi:uncharacterized protein LY79DRAFT_558518 [Colletotrichum navitas]|uniref:Uncharacterized protein n=1 Tax=Colletotrichum navitas TaxID=681940 RepID=A0AAD8PWJ5_9PEZI|nr:uncharacterized protein LY79DRAFT_558518 [Colletotrichum navitas]KAK1585421.1 hypothetical protein LY79DRAFT_558518 [Colletotrichum navitas]
MAPTYLDIAPDRNPRHSKDFIQVGCGELDTQFRTAETEKKGSPAAIEAKVIVYRGFKSWIMNSNVSAGCPLEDSDDLEAIACLQGYND